MSGPQLIEPAFPDDRGEPDPGLAEALVAYDEGRQGEHAVLTPLARARLLVPVVALVPASESTTAKPAVAESTVAESAAEESAAENSTAEESAAAQSAAEGSTAAEPAAEDSAAGDSTPEESAAEGSAPEGSAPEGSAPEGSAPEGSAPEGSAPEDSAAEESTTAKSAAESAASEPADDDSVAEESPAADSAAETVEKSPAGGSTADESAADESAADEPAADEPAAESSADEPADSAPGDGPEGEKETELALPIMIGADGRRGVLAFTSLETMARWQPQARPVPVWARQACQAAIEDGADALVIDVAGPVPFAVDGHRLRALAEGRPVPPPHEDPDVLAAIEAAVAIEDGISGVRVGPGEAAELSVRFTVGAGADEREAARRVADRLAAELRGRVVGGVEIGVARAKTNA